MRTHRGPANDMPQTKTRTSPSLQGVDARYHTVPLRPCTLFGSKNPQAPSLGRTDHNRFYVSGFGRPAGEDMVHDFTLSNFDPNNANFRLISTCTNTSEAGGSKAETDAQCDMLAVSLRKLFLRERDGGSWPEDEMTHDGEWKFLRDALSDKDNISINKFLEVTRQAYDDLSLLRPFLSYALHVVEDDAQALADVKSLWGPAYDAARVSRMAKEREGRWQHAEALGKSECRDEGGGRRGEPACHETRRRKETDALFLLVDRLRMTRWSRRKSANTTVTPKGRGRRRRPLSVRRCDRSFGRVLRLSLLV